MGPFSCSSSLKNKTEFLTGLLGKDMEAMESSKLRLSSLVLKNAFLTRVHFDPVAVVLFMSRLKGLSELGLGIGLIYFQILLLALCTLFELLPGSFP